MICVNNYRELLTITNYNVHHFQCKKQQATTHDTTLQIPMILLSYQSTYMPYSTSNNQLRLLHVARKNDRGATKNKAHGHKALGIRQQSNTKYKLEPQRSHKA